MSFNQNAIRKTVWFLLISLTALSGLTAAGIIVPRLELYTHGTMESSRLVLKTTGNVEMELEGGYKLGGNIVFKMDSEDLEDDSLDHILEYKYGSVTINDLFNIPLDFTYFVGEGDILCEGRGFTRTFGTQSFATQYSGFLYFSDGSYLYEGISRINGTGFALASNWGTDSLKTYLYAFQDNTLGYGRYSTVARGMLDTENLKLEGFLSASFPAAQAGLYSGGLMFYYKPAEIGSFFAQIGVPRWDPAGDTISANLFYFLFEPRIDLGLVSVVMTYFLRPGYYLMEATGEEGNMDINLNFLVGEPEVTPLSGGVETTGRLIDDGSGTNFNFSVSPYLGAIPSGVVWDCKVKINILAGGSTPLFEGFIGVKAEF